MHYRYLGLALLASATLQGGVQAQDAASARRLANTARLAAQEYRLGVQAGRVVAPAEVEEARLFLGEARQTAASLPSASRANATTAIDRLTSLVAATASPDSLDAGVTRLLDGLAAELKITLDEVPTVTPSLARGRDVYQKSCAGCHGLTGRGDGPQAPALSPPPANLSDSALAGTSPLDFYRRITVGTAGTSMPPYEHMLSSEERWAVALYAATLRLPRAGGQVPDSLRAFSRTARMSDREILAALGSGAAAAGVAAVRTATTQASATLSSVFSDVRRQLDSAYDLAHQGKGAAARTLAMDAYLTFERVEWELKAKDPGLTSKIESEFSSLRGLVGSGASANLGGMRQELARSLERAERTIVDRPARSSLMMQSFVILVREGLEAILVIGALMAFLVRSGNAHRRRDIHKGVGAAILMSLLTAAALETVFVLSRAHQEGMEGVVMLVATATLFYVSYWLISKLEVATWKSYVRGKMESALSGGSAFALASVAFLAVYREGFETVLFYKALAVSGGPGDWAPISIGILAGGAVLGVVYILINRFGIRLPLKPLFGVTSALLYYMAVVFAGKGIAELQESGAVPLTPVAGAPRIPALGVYPTLESLALQGLLILLAIVAICWVFVLEPARRRKSQPPAEAQRVRSEDAPGRDPVGQSRRS